MTCSQGLLAASPDAVMAEESEEETILPTACSLAFPSTGHPARQGRVLHDSQPLTPQAPGSSVLEETCKVKVMSLGAATHRSFGPKLKPCVLPMRGARTGSFWKGEDGGL